MQRCFSASQESCEAKLLFGRLLVMPKTVSNKHTNYRWDACKTACPTGWQAGGVKVRREARLWHFWQMCGLLTQDMLPLSNLRLHVQVFCNKPWNQESRWTGRDWQISSIVSHWHKNYNKSSSQECWITSRICLKKERVEWKDIKVLHRHEKQTMHPSHKQQAGEEVKAEYWEENL